MGFSHKFLFPKIGRLCLCLITDRTLLEDCLPIGAGRAIVQRWTNSRDGYTPCLLRQPNIQSSHPLSHLMPSIYPYGGYTFCTHCPGNEELGIPELPMILP